MITRRTLWAGVVLVALLVVLQLVLAPGSKNRAVRSSRDGTAPAGSRPASMIAPAVGPASVPPPAAASPWVPLPPAPYEGALVVAERESVPDADGVSLRTRLLRVEGKHPFVRVEETRRFDQAKGETVTVWRVAMVADHILVRLHPEATEADLEALNREFGATIRRRLKRGDHYLVAFESFDLGTVPQRVRDYRASPWVTEVAEPDYLVEPVDTLPDDPRYDELWGLETIRCPEAWDIETGHGGVVVGVIDSGVDVTHEDLVTNLWVNPLENPTNGIDDDANGYIDDVYGWDFGNDDAGVLGPSDHGTHVSGTITAVGSNSLGVAGVSWNSRVMVLKMFSDAGVGLTSDAIEALEYARAMRDRGVPIRLTNNSWGGGGYSSLMKSAIEDTGAAGMLFIAAAGNYSLNNDTYAFYPSSYTCSNILAVAATTSSDQLSYFSHYGAVSVDLAAPGVAILSTVPGGYDTKSGTSMATPHVSGACALIWEAYPEATWEQVRSTIMASVVTNAYLLGRMASGGRLDLAAAMYAIEPIIVHDPLVNTTNAVDDYVIEATVDPLTLLVSGSVQLRWNTDGPAYPYVSAPMTRITNNLYRATIPAQPLGGEVYYYIEAETLGGHHRTHPLTAPASPHHFEVVPPVLLWVSGKPAELGAVAPDYGIHELPRGIVVEPVADRFADETPGHRYECVGWAALGSAPARGATNRFTFVIEGNTALSWWWQSQYSLTQSSAPTGVVAAVTWWEANTAGETVVAPDPVGISTADYRFVEWQIDGQRWPDGSSAAANPAATIGMSAARQAVAIYLPTNEDSDGDDLPDWWERRYFGGLDPVIGDDPDGDGFDNGQELADRTNPRDPGSYPVPPTITHTPLADPQARPAPWPVTAVVTDNFSVASATLHWRKVPDAWSQVAMVAATGSLYEAAIPAPGILNEQFEYSLEAVDVAGHTNQSPVHRFNVVYPIFTFSPATVDVLMEPDTMSNIVVTLSNLGNTGLSWNAEAGWMDDVETGAAGVTHGGAKDIWHISTNRAYTGTNAWWCGDPGQGKYLNQVNAWLRLPPVFPVSGTFFTFRHWADIEYDEGRNDDHYWDGGVIEISTNGGVSFVQVEPVGGYPYRITPNDQSPFPYDTPCLAGDGEGWQETRVDLSPYAGRVVHLRLRFGSDWAVTEEGWYIDDLAVVFPSPMAGWLGMQPDSGSLAPGQSSMMTVRLDSAGMPTGALPGMVRLCADDPASPTNRVEVDLSVQATSDLRFLGVSGGGISASGTVVVFEWQGFRDRFYTLYERTSLVDMADSWTAVEGASNLPGIAGAMSHTVDVEHVDQRFYRLTVH